MHYFCRAYILCMALFISITECHAWGQKGHDIVCTIASRHLTKKAKKQVNQLLDGRSMVYWSNWMDNASHTPEYAYTKTWHYKNVDAGISYEDAPIEQKGDVVNAVKKLMADITDKTASNAQKALALKMFIHLVGDMHQPMHMGHKSDLGGNRWTLRFFGKNTNLHSIWDTDVIEHGHKWSHNEWAEELDRLNKAEIKEICKGSVDSWAMSTHQIATEIYATTPQNANLSYDYLAKWVTTAEQQLLYAGVRLAYLLNEMF